MNSKNLFLKTIFPVLLLSLVLQNCLTMISKLALEGIDNRRNHGLNSNCTIETYRNFKAGYYSDKILPFIAIPESLAGIYGMFYYYPNGLKMYASFGYLYFAGIIGFGISGDESMSRANKSSANHSHWTMLRKSDCSNSFFEYKNNLNVQIDLTKREYSQILGNNFSNGKTFEAICKNNQAALEEDFFSKLFFLYDPEIQKISNRARRYAPEIDEKRMEIEIAKLEKKIFSKQKIQSIWQREKFSYTSYVESARYEYPATLNCAFSFYFQYPGGSEEFKTHIEKYFVK